MGLDPSVEFLATIVGGPFDSQVMRRMKSNLRASKPAVRPIVLIPKVARPPRENVPISTCGIPAQFLSSASALPDSNKVGANTVALSSASHPDAHVTILFFSYLGYSFFCVFMFDGSFIGHGILKSVEFHNLTAFGGRLG
jgi:hypothetical protein